MPPPLVLQLAALWFLILAALLADLEGAPRRQTVSRPSRGQAICPHCGAPLEAGPSCECWKAPSWP